MLKQLGIQEIDVSVTYLQVPRNKAAHAWALRTAERWVEAQLLGAAAARVRAAAALLLVALVPSQHFRAGYARARPAAPAPPPHAPHAPHANHAKLPDTAHHTLHQVGYLTEGEEVEERDHHHHQPLLHKIKSTCEGHCLLLHVKPIVSRRRYNALPTEYFCWV